MVFQVREKRLHVLLWQRAEAPFPGAWALPGGSLLSSERLGTSASRHLAEKVDISEIAHLEQLETRSDPARDPRGRVLATAYLALVTAGAQPRLPADTAWHPVDELPEWPSTTSRSSGRPRRAAAREALLHQHRVRARAGDVHDRRTAGHLRGDARLPGVRDQPAADPGSTRGDRADLRGRPVGRRGRPPRDDVPVRVAATGGDEPVRRVPPTARVIIMIATEVTRCPPASRPLE